MSLHMESLRLSIPFPVLVHTLSMALERPFILVFVHTLSIPFPFKGLAHDADPTRESTLCKILGALFIAFMSLHIESKHGRTSSMVRHAIRRCGSVTPATSWFYHH